VKPVRLSLNRLPYDIACQFLHFIRGSFIEDANPLYFVASRITDCFRLEIKEVFLKARLDNRASASVQKIVDKVCSPHASSKKLVINLVLINLNAL
jgi:hypothetical protein